ncbi:MAG: ligase-associated DNA damage response exonuclease [Beijerinckiaceae bacterium]
MPRKDLVSLTPVGLYCKAGDFYIDPTRPVTRALITHGHSDHARAGHAQVLATRETLAIMAVRCGADFAASTQAVAYGKTLRLGDVSVSFYPAGHILGSAQILLAGHGTRIVVSGDYKRESDPTCPPFEPLACDTFITEATFGLPVYRHADAGSEIGKLLASQRLFPERTHLVGAYALGKAQRLIALMRAAHYDRPIFIHGALEKLTEFYAAEGVELGDIRKIEGREAATLAGEIVICPPSAVQDVWARKFPDPLLVFASGWMRVRARARQRRVELPLVISDHADWDGLCATIIETGCGQLLVTHGEGDALIHFARGRGILAESLHLLGYGDEEMDRPVEAEA